LEDLEDGVVGWVDSSSRRRWDEVDEVTRAKCR
jgi:hypothetical protein